MLTPCPLCQRTAQLRVEREPSLDVMLIWRVSCAPCGVSVYEQTALDAMVAWEAAWLDETRPPCGQQKTPSR